MTSRSTSRRARSSASSVANEAGKSDALPRGVGPGACIDRGRADDRPVEIDGRATTGRPLYELATAVGIASRTPQRNCRAIAGLGLRGGRARADEPRAQARETVARTRAALATLAIEDLAERRPRRLSGGRGSSWCWHRCWPCVRRTSSSTSRRRNSIRRARAWSARPCAAWRRAVRRCSSPSTRPTAGRPCQRVVAIDDGRLVADGPTAEILADPAVEDYGVEPPSGSARARARGARARSEVVRR